MSLKYEPASEPLHIAMKWRFLDRELYTFGVLEMRRPEVDVPVSGVIDSGKKREEAAAAAQIWNRSFLVPLARNITSPLS